jgi:flagellar biosynthesis/type III secretory pathway chaperone
VPAKETLEAFVAVLHREQEALAAGDIDALAPLITEKYALAEKLNQFSVDAATSYRDLVSEARALNEANGKLIGLYMQNNQQALGALLGAADKATTYGPDGQQQAGLGSRILGKA